MRQGASQRLPVLVARPGPQTARGGRHCARQFFSSQQAFDSLDREECAPCAISTGQSKTAKRLCYIIIRPATFCLSNRQGSAAGDQGRCGMATKTFERLNPLTGKVATKAAAFTPAEAAKAADAAAAAFPAWSALGPNARRAALTKAAEELAKRADDFVKAMAGE